jgi:GNAT superfamily N-acetyltransferase
VTRVDPTIRPATEDEATTARSVLDAAMLETTTFADRLATEDVLVALVEGRVVGAAIRTPHHTRGGAHVEAIAVRPGRRGQGIGRALIESVAESGPVTGEFAATVRPFYESLGFSIRRLDDDRFRGLLDG